MRLNKIQRVLKTFDRKGHHRQSQTPMNSEHCQERRDEKVEKITVQINPLQ